MSRFVKANNVKAAFQLHDDENRGSGSSSLTPPQARSPNATMTRCFFFWSFLVYVAPGAACCAVWQRALLDVKSCSFCLRNDRMRFEEPEKALDKNRPRRVV